MKEESAMKKIIIIIQMITVVAAVSSANAQLEWRFGFEDTWGHFIGFMTEAQKEALIAKLEVIAQPQSSGGDINFPAVNSGWKGMQSGPGAEIDFTASDKVIRLLQKHGFSMLWNLRINATWASIDNPDCYGSGDCAPDSAHENDLYDFIFTLVERYDGDGNLDMGYETPNDPSDDLTIPVQRYLMTGEIEFAGASPPPLIGGYGDDAVMHFWTDSMENLLRTHRIICQAIHDADPTGSTKLISSGGVFWDLYSDFPDWPQIEGPTVQARLNGQNNHQVKYIKSFGRLKQILTSFGDDSDGIECDYIGWHPHTPWREIEQTFTFIKTFAGDKPIYVDDMWCNIFLIDRDDAPGNTLFTGGGKTIEGDFPNSLVPGYTALKNGVLFNNPQIVAWYYARHARTIVKAFASVFGEGAERASISGIADFLGDKLGIMGTMNENFYEKPGYYTYQLLVEKLHDFTTAMEIAVSNDPRTRVYKFDRPRGSVYVMWSETGDAPPDMDYRNNPTGETVTFEAVNNVDSLRLTHIITDTVNTIPDVKMVPTQGGQFTIRLGYEPIFLEGDLLAVVTDVESHSRSSLPSSFELKQNYPNPFNPETVIVYDLPKTSHVQLVIYDLLGRHVKALINKQQQAGHFQTTWDGTNEHNLPVAAGVYLCRMEAGEFVKVIKLALVK
jgi:hypothetical protein